MGVPKFFRYISERYPCLSELVKEYQIPEFDNLYLDMNGIIHMCSHPDDGNPHFRISEEKIFKDIFHYIEVLFRMIKPQKVFFMAIDGVAPRAKMNQQRGRRFRSAKDALKQEADALKKGEKLPEEARFDSNCITPGTVFMARLHEQLKYFVVDKISNDPLWQKCKVILSGHETPGEGEHKIMDYIRYIRAQPGYDPNTRHCLYGLDADLIMLGLCTHEPHFSLLREEVKFGKKSSKRMSVPEEITFFLLHLSLMREYLELEFAPLRDKLKGFEYDFEKIIDDWVLMGFLVGNDFIPHLPNLHITNGALPILYKAYMDILPSLDGYINEAGTLNLKRFEIFMQKLGALDLENFEEIRDDLLYMEAKTGRKHNAHPKVSTKNLEEWTSEDTDEGMALESLEPQKPRDSGLAALIKETDEWTDTETDEETESGPSDEDEAFTNYKKDYYKNKMEYSKVTPLVMRSQAEGYVRAIQWNLNYYYNGCCSWSWYYPHHYAPYISDIKGFSNLKIEFDMGKPFLPYEQLLAVLPTASKDLLPSCYHDLMTEENSLIKQYYPEDFQTDLNGKKQDWEAVVLVPFINENLLLEAMSYCNDKLTTEEKQRNTHGPMLIYTYTPRDKGQYPAPSYFPEITHNHTEVKCLMYDDIRLPKEKLVKGAYPGVRMNVYYPGFPTMKHLKYKAELKMARIRVFETPSRNENMIITILPDQKLSGDAIPVDLLGTTVFVGWPHLVEAKVTMISNHKKKFISMGGPNQYNVEDQSSPSIFNQQVQGVDEYYQKRFGINFGETKVLVHTQVMIGRKYIFTPNGRLTLEKQFATNISNYPLHSIVFDISTYDEYGSLFKDIEEVFPKDSICFTITNPYYGSQGVVQDSSQTKKSGRIKISVSVLEEPNFDVIRHLYQKNLRSYKTCYNVASQLSISNILFSRITGSIFIAIRNSAGEPKNVNIGLDLKMNKKNKETPGYTKKVGTTWCYTDKAVELVRSYCEKFPEVFLYLRNDPSFEDIKAEKIFGDDYEERLSELQVWLKSLPVYSIERQTSGSLSVEPEVVAEIERIVDEFKAGNVKKVTMIIKPNFLYRPEIQNGSLMPDPKVETRILDRVVNVRTGFSVPFGLKGTVTSIQEANTGSNRDIMYDIVFDKPFKDGMKLNCSENRGYRLPGTAFINISYGQRLMVEKTGKPDELIAKAKASNEGSIVEISAQQQQWYLPQQHPYANQQQQQQTQTDFNKPNSAFAQFAGILQKKLQTDGVEIDNKPSQSERLQDSKDVQSIPQQGNDTSLKENDRPLWRETSYEKVVYQQQQQQQEVRHNRDNRLPKDTSWSTAPSQAFNTHQPNTSWRQESQQWQGKPPNQDFSRQSFGQQNNGVYRFNQEQQQMPWLGNDKPHAQRHVKERNDFMPDFRNNGQEGQKTVLRQIVDTDYLKNILKIGDQDNKKIEENRKKKSPPPKIASSDVNSSNISFEMLASVANTPASIRLLTYYQSNGLGLPRYQYFSTNGNKYQAQITLPEGKLMVGKAAATKEEASEIVANDVLDFLMTKKGNHSQNSNTIPAPPKDWVSPRNSRAEKQVGNSPQKAKKGSDTTAVLNNSFVPLQAIKNHISKNSNSSSRQAEQRSKENIKTQHNTKAVSKKDTNTEKDPNLAKEKQTKPKKERKTRIAANFQQT